MAPEVKEALEEAIQAHARACARNPAEIAALAAEMRRKIENKNG